MNTTGRKRVKVRNTLNQMSRYYLKDSPVVYIAVLESTYLDLSRPIFDLPDNKIGRPIVAIALLTHHKNERKWKHGKFRATIGKGLDKPLLSVSAEC